MVFVLLFGICFDVGFTRLFRSFDFLGKSDNLFFWVGGIEEEFFGRSGFVGRGIVGFTVIFFGIVVVTGLYVNFISFWSVFNFGGVVGVSS